MTWFYLNKPFTSEELQKLPDNVIGFVYLITRKSDGKKYVGKKGFWTRKIVQKNKKKKKVKVESDWEKYWSSSEELKKEVLEKGNEEFFREILRLCISKSEMNYYELEEQMIRKVLLRDDYFNSFVGTKIHRKHINKK